MSVLESGTCCEDIFFPCLSTRDLALSPFLGYFRSSYSNLDTRDAWTNSTVG